MRIEGDSLNKACDVIAKDLDGGIIIILGVSGEELVRCAFAENAFFPSENGSCRAQTISTGTVTKTGRCSKFVCVSDDGRKICSGDAGVSGNVDMRFPTDQFFKGMVISIEQFSLNVGGLNA